MLAEGGEERGAMVGVHRESIHQLACVLTDLCEWVDDRMLILRLLLLSALPAHFMAVGSPEVRTAAADSLSSRLPPVHTPHQTHNR